jgi:hypothetical protein
MRIHRYHLTVEKFGEQPRGFFQLALTGLLRWLGFRLWAD